MFLFAALIAGAFSIGKRAAPFIDPGALTAARFLLAGCIVAAALAVFGIKPKRQHFRAPWRYLVLGGLMGGYFVFMFEALKTAAPVSTSAMFTLIPAMSAGFGWLMLRQRTTPVAMLALLIGAVGAVWVIFRADIKAILGFDLGYGESIFFVGCVCHAVYTPMVRKLNRGEPVPVYTLLTIMGAAVVVGAYAIQPVMQTEWAVLPMPVWIALGYLSVFTTGITFALLQFAALYLPSGKVMAYGYLTPSFVALYEGISGHGWPAPLVWVGVGLILCALLILLMGED
jgi:drug/metabolite transporter (DMT)-like permease